jgi:hypothetical protein
MTTINDKPNNIYYTNIVLDDEFKELIYKNIKCAQDVFHQYYLPNLTAYSPYHVPLETYFMKKYNKSPSKPDKLTFLLLLTYPIHILRNFNSVRDIKLTFRSEQSDFEIFGEKILTKNNINEYNNDDFEEGFVNTCICSKGIQNIFILKNKYNDITFQVGCDCIEKNGLVSKEEIKIHKTKVELLREHEKEIMNNKPEGYYEKLRQEEKIMIQEEKIIKQENKLMLNEEKISKKNEQYINKELKRLNKNLSGSYLSKKCYFCKSDTIFKSTEIVLLCSKCCSQEQKEKKKIINYDIKKIKECSKCKHYFENKKGIFNKLCDTCYQLKECINCEKDFNGENDLCLECEIVYKIKKCLLCPFNFIVSHKCNDLYCDECDKTLIKCVDCKTDMLKKSCNNTRCEKCHNIFVYKIRVKICEYCDDEFEIKEHETWKTCCSECYFDNRKLETCQDCDEYFKKMKNETWRTRCGPCYYKNKNKNSVTSC